MSRKSTTIYLALVFGFSFIGFPALIHLGVLRFQDRNILHNAAFVATMFFPALVVWLARLISGEDASSGLKVHVWPLPWGKAVLWAVGTPAVFLATGLIASLLGKVVMQWNMGELVVVIDKQSATPLPPSVHGALPALFLVFGPLASAVAGVTAYALIALGGEIGWRSFLLPRCLKFGRYPGYALTGVLWGLWFTPLVWGYYSASGEMGEIWTGWPCFMGMAVVWSFILGELWRRTEHLGLCAVALGSFAGQASGIWPYLFTQGAAPYAGPFGVVSLGVWGAVALVLAVLPGRMKVDGVGEK